MSLALFNGNYALASFLIDSGSDVNKANVRGFNPLFWAVDRRNMETAPNFPWTVTEDPLPLAKKLLDHGAFDLGKKNDGAFGASIEPLSNSRASCRLATRSTTRLPARVFR